MLISYKDDNLVNLVRTVTVLCKGFFTNTSNGRNELEYKLNIPPPY